MQPEIKPFEFHSEEPQLSGRLFYGPPFPWNPKVDNDHWIISSDGRGLKTVAVFLIMLSIIATILITCVVCRSGTYWRLFLAPGPGIALATFAGSLYERQAKENKMGPLMIFSRKDRILRFPKNDIEVNHSDALSWKMLSGCGVRNPGAANALWGDVISEIHLAYILKDKQMRLPLIGGLGRRSLIQYAEAVSKFTDIPLNSLSTQSAA